MPQPGPTPSPSISKPHDEKAGNESPFGKILERARITKVEDVPESITGDVTTSEPDEKFTPFPRGDGTTKSNCTWYAATALAAHTGGKIDLHAIHKEDRMSDAHHWSEEAQEAIDDKDHPLHGYVKDVDEKPEAGTIISYPISDDMPYGHVAWVEKAEMIVDKDGNKKWELTISEENYGGSNGFTGATAIGTTDSDVKRWRRTISFPVADNDGSKAIVGTGIKFIHWDQDYNKN